MCISIIVSINLLIYVTKIIFHNISSLLFSGWIDTRNDIISYMYDIKTNPTQLLPFKHCVEVKMTTNKVYLASQTGFNFYLSDPNRKTRYRVDNNALLGAPLTINPRDEMKLAEAMFYNVQTILHKKRRDKEEEGECRDYGEDGYADCVTVHLHKNLIETVGCLPPWVSQGNKGTQNVCPSLIDLKDKSKAAYIKKILRQFNLDVMTMGQVKFFLRAEPHI